MMAGGPTTNTRERTVHALIALIRLLIFSVVILTGFVLAQAPGRSPTQGRYIGD